MLSSIDNPLALPPEAMSVTHLKSKLQDFYTHQETAFSQQTPTAQLIQQRSDFMDALLIRLWQHFELSQSEHLTLIAVGGFGRQEIHPLSDIDLLLLHKKPLTEPCQEKISTLLTLLWDLRLEVGHSVRTLEECLHIGQSDLTVATNLQEARFIMGDKAYFDRLKSAVNSPEFWPSREFFHAKLDEQQARHARYHNTAYNLEPDIKSSPGGLRDIHTLSWIARRHFGATSLREMSQHGFLTDAEFRELDECQTTLWRIRFALHLQLKRYDNRLTFAHQGNVAQCLGYQGEGNQPIEKMMKDFYRTLGRVTELNKMLIRLFNLAIEHRKTPLAIIPLTADFQRKGNLIEARKPALFQSRPETILDMLLLIADDKSLESISASTLRQLRTARRRLNLFLHEIPSARKKFIQLVKHPNALFRAFPLMHKHGILAAYIPQWSQIVGQMQFDLFHAYTVDEHTMRLLKHIEQFRDLDYQSQTPICYDVFPRLAKPELLLLAAIFHDIGKGRGGDHSEIGAKEAQTFCLNHGLSKPEANLVAWLVKHHLLMSVTAQKRDIYDPSVIIAFAEKIRDEEHLDYLICLTVADINATNPNLWNSWKRTLLTELYYATQKMLRRGLENPPDVRAKIRHNQHLASAILRKRNFTAYQISHLWQRFKADYFLRHTHKQIAWHCDHIFHHQGKQALVLISKHATRGGTEIFIYSEDRPGLFAKVVAKLDQKNLNVHDAQVMTSKDGFSLDTFMVLDNQHQAIPLNRHFEIKQAIQGSLSYEKPSPNFSPRHPPSQLLAFQVKTQVNFLPTRSKKRTRIEVIALDKPGLLAHIGQVFFEQSITIHSAKIATIGERAEDFFTVTHAENRALTPSEEKTLKTALMQTI